MCNILIFTNTDSFLQYPIHTRVVISP